MSFNRRKMEDQRRDAAEKEAASRRATDPQVFEDAEQLVRLSRQASPTKCARSIGAREWAIDRRKLTGVRCVGGLTADTPLLAYSPNVHGD